MKKIAFLFVSAVMIMLFALTAGAASESDLTFELNDDGNSYYVSDCKESAQGELAIPAVYNGNPVTKIGDNAFENCESLTYITIPDGVISIGEYAFLFCSSLTDVAIPDNVTFIGDFAFSYCANLTGVTIPDGVTSIGGWAFYSCDSLTSIIIPDSVTTIGENASYGCKSLTDVYYGGTETQWNDITIFDGNEYLTNATIHFSSSSDDANESALSFELNDDGNSYYVSDCDYDAEGNLTVPAIYDGKAVTKIGPYAFEDCISLTGIIIPDSVTSIDYNAFMGCKSLTSITIPDSVTSIGNGAFSGCKTLTGITV
ncbi:MAG: leucine-rich repeat domain-containing protein, partial [Clostridia bacterium]|nr:leucine-rich repeat domain-containing protein [Clostridia bacterium]